MVIPHPEDATHYQLADEGWEAYYRLDRGAQGRFRITMQWPGMEPAHNANPARRIQPRNEDDPPLYIVKLSDIWVVYARAEDGSPIVHNLYPDPDSPFPARPPR